jgi:hypothetical protein
VANSSTGKQTETNLAWLVAVWQRLPEKAQRAILEIARRGAGE